MKLYFKQRFFSWFDSYDIYDYDTGDIRWRGSWPGVTVCTFWTQAGGTSPR